MTARFFPTAAHLLCCRGIHCSARAPELYRQATAFAERECIAYYRKGGQVRLTASSCLGACEHGPIVVCYGGVHNDHEQNDHKARPEQAWFAAVSLETAQQILTALQNKTALPKEGRFDE